VNFYISGLLLQFDPDVEEDYALERKLALLDAVEANWRAGYEEKSSNSQYANSYSYYQYGSGNLMADVLENLQVYILLLSFFSL
jgi:hypothetical protein